MAPSAHRPTSIEATLTGLLSPEAAATYVHALEAPGSITPSEPAVAELLERGLVRVVEATGEVQALPPEAAVTAALHAATEAWLAAAPNFDGVLRTISRLPATPPEPVSGTIDDATLFQQVIERMFVLSQTSLWCMQPYPHWFDEAELADVTTWTRNHETSPTHVQYRYVYDQRLLRFSAMRDAALEEIAQGCEIRFASWELPTFMVIMDRHTAIYSADGDPKTEVSDDPGHVGLLCLAFDTAFARAVPLLNEPTLSPAHQQIHTFLALGHTNRMIGSMLKLNERTVRRRVYELMEHHGVSSRHELVNIATSATTTTDAGSTGSSQ